MNRNLLIALTTGAALAAPLAAQAQIGTDVIVSTTVAEACVVGSPTVNSLQFGDLTGPDGRLNPSIAAKTIPIATAWCNSPGIMKLTGSPLRLQSAPAYSSPAGFARTVTFDADLTGWTEALMVRPLVDNTIDAAAATASAYAATGLTLVVSDLAAVTAAGTESTDAVLEAGAYKGSVTVTVSLD